jgi:hypothetical protein
MRRPVKPRNVIALGLVAIATLMAIQTGCGRGSISNVVAGNPHRVVTISSVSPGVSNPCEVDFPVTLLRISKNHTITWAAEDHDYWILFDRGNGSPIGANKIFVAKGGRTSQFPITISPCKRADDEHDTGLNVKR